MEVEVPRKSYGTEFISMDNEKGKENVAKNEGGGFLKAHIFTLTIPQASVQFILCVFSVVLYLLICVEY